MTDNEYPQISPILGPPLMFIFVCMTNILLITSLISLMSNSLTKVCKVTCSVSHRRPAEIDWLTVFLHTHLGHGACP